MSEMPFEGPVEDVTEQHTTAVPDTDEPATDRWAESSLEADPADAQEQVAEVPIDEDEWR
jgi:hypothetical protein